MRRFLQLTRATARTRWLVPVTAIFAAGSPSVAYALNPIAEIPRVEDAAGIKVGERSTFHPGVAAMFGYDSNVFAQSRNEGQRQAAFFMPLVWLNIGNRAVRDRMLDSPPDATDRVVDYAIGVKAGYRLYLTSDQVVRDAGKFNIDVLGRVGILPGRRFSLDLDEDFRRIGEPQNFEATREFNFNRIDQSAALRATVRPGGGRLAFSVAYRNSLLFFENGDLPTGNRMVNGLEHQSSYRFRDRSAVALRYSFHATQYACCDERGTGRNEDNHAHRVMGGYVGQVGQRFTLEAMAGYGVGLYRKDINGPDHKGFIGHAAVGYYPTIRTRLELRGGRTFTDATFGNYFADVGGTISGEHNFRTRTFIRADLGVFSRRTAGLPVPGVETDQIESYENAPGFVRNDVIFTVRLQAEQSLGKLFNVALRYVTAVDRTDFAVNYTNGFRDELAFDRHLVMLFGAVRY